MSNIRVKNRGKNDTIDRMLKRFKRAFQDSEIRNTAIYEQTKLDKLNKENDGL